MAPLETSHRPPAPAPARIWKPDGKTARVYLLGIYHGQWLHWMGRRCLPCLDEECPSARHSRPAHWTAYYPAALFDRKFCDKQKTYVGAFTRIVLPLSPENVAELDHFSTWPLAVEIKPRATGRGVEIASVQEAKPPKGLPGLFEVRTVLFRVFGIRPPENGHHQVEQERNGQ